MWIRWSNSKYRRTYILNNCKLQVYYMSKKTTFNVIYCNHMFILTPFLSQPSQPLLPCPLKLRNLTTPNEPKWVWVCEGDFHIRNRKYKFEIISVCLINDYSLIADLHIFVHGSAECATILLECTKLKPHILKILI